jgi:hypothetical protein
MLGERYLEAIMEGCGCLKSINFATYIRFILRAHPSCSSSQLRVQQLRYNSTFSMSVIWKLTFEVSAPAMCKLLLGSSFANAGEADKIYARPMLRTFSARKR